MNGKDLQVMSACAVCGLVSGERRFMDTLEVVFECGHTLLLCFGSCPKCSSSHDKVSIAKHAADRFMRQRDFLERCQLN